MFRFNKSFIIKLDLPPILLPCSTNNIEASENLLFNTDANVQADIPAPMTTKS